MEQEQQEQQEQQAQQEQQPKQTPAQVPTDPPNQQPTDDVVMVYDKQNKKYQAVANATDENGEYPTVEPTRENANKFLRITDRGFWPNVWTNLKNQFNDPTKFAIFRIPTQFFEQSKVAFQRYADQSDKQAGDFLYNYLVGADGRYEKNAKLYDITPERIPFPELSEWHITPKLMEGFGAIPAVTRGDWTPLLPFWKREENALFKGWGKLKFYVNTRTGKVNYKLHTILPKPEIELDSKYGHVFSQADKTNLKETLNMGRLGTITDSSTGEKFPAFFSYDEDLGEIFAMRADRVNLQKGIYGHNYTVPETTTLKSGGVIEVDNLKGRPNKDGVVTTFKGKLQINAQKGRVALVYSSQQRLNNRLDRIAARKAEKESNIYSMPVDQFLQMIEKQAVPAETVPQQDNAGINQAPPSQIRPESNVVPIGEEQINPAPVQTAAPAKADVPEQTTAPKQTNTPVQTEQTPGKSPEKTVQPPKVVPVTVAAKKGGKNRGPSLT